ncbi:MAG TPA: zinc ABC transporter substrate-binding protein [Gammaproteobacteria bacterium]
MKKLLAFMLLMFPFFAQASINIFACEPEWASLAEEIGKDKVSVFSATTGKQDPHHIEARPSLIAKARSADFLICTGADLEAGWLPLLVKKSANSKIIAGASGHFMASDYVELLDKPQILDRSQGDIHAAGNPHFHLNPHHILSVAKAFSARLGEIDKANSDFYQASLSDFSQRWQVATTAWENQARVIKNKAYAVDHKSWIYLADWLHIDMSTSIEPKPGIPPGSEHLSQLIKLIKEKNIQKIFYSAHANPRAAQWLANQTGVPAIELPYTVGGNDKAENLFSLFDETLRLLLK